MTNEEAWSLSPGDRVLAANEFYKYPFNTLRPLLGQIVTVESVSGVLEDGESMVLVEIEEADTGFYAQELSCLCCADLGSISDDSLDIKLLFGGDG